MTPFFFCHVGSNNLYLLVAAREFVATVHMLKILCLLTLWSRFLLKKIFLCRPSGISSPFRVLTVVEICTRYVVIVAPSSLSLELSQTETEIGQ